MGDSAMGEERKGKGRLQSTTGVQWSCQAFWGSLPHPLAYWRTPIPLGRTGSKGKKVRSIK